MNTRVADNTQASRFELWSDQLRIGLIDYTIADGVMTLPHTEVDPAHGGHGHGATLAKAALDSAREQGLKVDPECPFIAAYIEKNPAYADLVV